MDNAAKALMIAGGMIFVLLIVSLLIYAWSSFSDYYDNDADLAAIEDLTEFNLQFSNYDRDDVMGYEIISLMNKVVDYNNTSSNLDDADSNDSYNPITLVVIGDEDNSYGAWAALSLGQITVTYSNTNTTTYGSNSAVAFTVTTYKVYEDSSSSYLSNSLDSLLDTIKSWGKYTCGSEDAASNVAKSISSIALSESQLNYNKSYYGMTYKESYQTALDTYNSLVTSRRYKI